MSQPILDRIDSMADDVVELQRALVAIPALGPDNDGDGEKEKADFIIDWLRTIGMPEIQELNAPDTRVSCGYRPNILARIPGQDTTRTLWVISHTDIVPPGDPALWDSDPYELHVDGDIMIGRGVEDDHCGVVPSMLLAKAIVESGQTPPINYGLLLVADEETSSEYGLEYVAREHEDIFGENDLIVVPDMGLPDSSMIEVAEKSMCWMRIETVGKQCHASTPAEGANAMVAASELAVRMNEELPRRFPDEDPLFSPAMSTFTPTKREANVPNVNTLPGKDVFFLDARVLPHYELDDVETAVRELCGPIAEKYGVAFEIGYAQREQAAPPTPEDSDIVQRLTVAIKDVYGTDAKPAGVGGGTVAAILRNNGHEAAVWSTIMHNAHQPNERGSIRMQVGDMKVLTKVLFA